MAVSRQVLGEDRRRDLDLVVERLGEREAAISIGIDLQTLRRARAGLLVNRGPYVLIELAVGGAAPRAECGA
jgi:hypothetical protein